MIVQIDYDLNKVGQNYDGLINKINSLGTSRIKACKSCWLVDTSWSTRDIFNSLSPLIDKNDLLMVTAIDINTLVGQLNPAVVSWINARRGAVRDLT